MLRNLSPPGQRFHDTCYRCQRKAYVMSSDLYFAVHMRAIYVRTTPRMKVKVASVLLRCCIRDQNPPPPPPTVVFFPGPSLRSIFRFCEHHHHTLLPLSTPGQKEVGCKLHLTSCYYSKEIPLPPSRKNAAKKSPD